MEHDPRPGLVALALLAPASLLALVGVSQPSQPAAAWASATDGIPGVLEWVDDALILAGASYLALVLALWRVWLWRRPRSASTWVFLPPLLLLLAPVPQLISGAWSPPWQLVSREAWAELGFYVWIYPGMGGWVTVPLALALGLELFVRLRRNAAASPPATWDHAPPHDPLPAADDVR